MLSRISQVQKLKIKTVSISSVTQIGDSQIINSLTRALAVQREVEIFFENEGDFSQYHIFKEQIPLPLIEEEIIFHKTDLTPCIRVPHITIDGVTSASIVHVGNTGCVYLESRIKHIRHLQNEN